MGSGSSRLNRTDGWSFGTKIDFYHDAFRNPTTSEGLPAKFYLSLAGLDPSGHTVFLAIPHSGRRSFQPHLQCMAHHSSSTRRSGGLVHHSSIHEYCLRFAVELALAAGGGKSRAAFSRVLLRACVVLGRIDIC